MESINANSNSKREKAPSYDWATAGFEVYLRKEHGALADDVRAIVRQLKPERMMKLMNGTESAADLTHDLLEEYSEKLAEMQRLQKLFRDKDRMARIIAIVRQWKERQ